jgi:dienelactone hydrolase
VGAGVVSDSERVRNFSNWAYWRLHLDAVVEGDPCPVDSLDTKFAFWEERARERLEIALGPSPLPVALDIEVTDSVDCGTYSRERVVFDTENTMAVPAYLLVPHGRRGQQPGPAVLAVHGHGAGKSLICGVDDDSAGNDYAHELASAGYVVLAPDLRGFGERADWMPPDKYHCDWDLVCATMAGVVPLGRNLWDLQRALDALGAQPEVDSGRIGVVGFSYGATCALFLAAVDERVRLTVVSGYLSSWRAAHTVPWNMCGSQVMPGQLGRFEHLDIAALAAPRPLLVESGTRDLIFPVDAARATVDALQHVYDFLGAPADALAHHVFDGEHEWNGAQMLEFMRRWS